MADNGFKHFKNGGKQEDTASAHTGLDAFMTWAGFDTAKEKAESYTVIEYYETAIQPNAAHFPSGLKNAAKASDNTKNSVNDFTRASLLKGHGRD